MIDDRIAAVVDAAIAWAVTEAAYGAADPHTQATIDTLRQAVARVQPDDLDEPPRPRFTVVPDEPE
jgi:hypothetical protein